MKKIISLLIALPLLMVACNNNDEPTKPIEKKEAKLERISEAEMTFESTGGDGIIYYQYTPADINGNTEIKDTLSEAKATVDADWITIFEEQINGEVKFVVAANESDARVATITVSVDELSFCVAISQAAGEPEPKIEGWAVVGSMTNNWDINAAIAMESTTGYYVARGIEISSSDSFKFIKDGLLQNGLGGNGKAAERDYKYPTSQYGSDIRVKESGIYDLYLNEALNTYYLMSEGKNPAEAYEELKPGDDIWYVSGLGEEIRMRNVGIYVMVSGVSIDEDGFKLRHSLTGTYGATEQGTNEIGNEINIALNSEHNICVSVESNKVYDIYLNVDDAKVWVVARGSKPDVLYTCSYAEGVWFNNQNFMIYLQGEGFKLYIDCNAANPTTDWVIAEGTYAVGGEDGNVINIEGSEIANENGKSQILSGTISFTHIADGYNIQADIVSIKQQRLRAQYIGAVASNAYMGGGVTNPSKE